MPRTSLKYLVGMVALIACLLTAFSPTPAATTGGSTSLVGAPTSASSIGSPIKLITEYYCEIVGRNHAFVACPIMPTPAPTPTPVPTPAPMRTMAPPGFAQD